MVILIQEGNEDNSSSNHLPMSSTGAGLPLISWLQLISIIMTLHQTSLDKNSMQLL